MRKIIIVVLCSVLMKFNSFSQIDFVAMGSGLTPSPIAFGDTTVLDATLAFNSTLPDLSGTLGTGCLQVLVSFDENKLQYLGPTTSGSQPFIITGSFNWLYVPGDGVYGSNTVPFVDGDGGSILLQFKSIVNGAPTVSQLSTNLSDVFSCTNSNDGSNDATFATIVLPVVYKSIVATSNKCDGNLLEWITSSEVNNSHFDVEASRDGKTFITLGTVKGANKNTGASYSFVDETSYASGQTIYYRLKQFDFNGKSQYSKVVSTKYVCDRPFGITLSPNPAKDEVRVEFEGTNIADINAVILDDNGSLVREVTLNTGLVNKININTLTPGVYTLKTEVNGEQVYQRFIKVD
jgi:hypothetical protein